VKEELEKYRNLEKRGQLDKGAKDKKAVLEKMYEQVQEYRKVSGGSSQTAAGSVGIDLLIVLGFVESGLGS